MKTISLLGLAVAAAVLAMPATSQAKNKGDKANKPGKIVKQYDTNGNGIIDGSEVDAVRAAFAADKNGPLKQFDTNNDGTLSDEEIAAMKTHKKGDKKKKKNQ